jgi:4-hydroxybenzoate polyprenyltransferase
MTWLSLAKLLMVEFYIHVKRLCFWKMLVVGLEVHFGP